VVEAVAGGTQLVLVSGCVLAPCIEGEVCTVNETEFAEGLDTETCHQVLEGQPGAVGDGQLGQAGQMTEVVREEAVAVDRDGYVAAVELKTG